MILSFLYWGRDGHHSVEVFVRACVHYPHRCTYAYTPCQCSGAKVKLFFFSQTGIRKRLLLDSEAVVQLRREAIGPRPGCS